MQERNEILHVINANMSMQYDITLINFIVSTDIINDKFEAVSKLQIQNRRSKIKHMFVWLK